MIKHREQINAVRRQVGSRTLEAGEARVVTLSQTYRASLDDVWDACTNPERIPRWFARSPATSGSTAATSSPGTRRARSNAAIRPTASPPPGSTAATSAGSTFTCHPSPPTAPG